MTSELVTNGVQHPSATVDSLILEVSVDSGVIRVGAADGGSGRIRPKPVAEARGWGLGIVADTASRWGAGRERGLNVVWFELDLPAPGA